MKPNPEQMESMRQQFAQQQLGVHGVQLAVLEQMWLELVRALDEQGALNAEALALRLEAHAQRSPDVAGWFYGLHHAAQMLRLLGAHPDDLVQ